MKKKMLRKMREICNAVIGEEETEKIIEETEPKKEKEE